MRGCLLVYALLVIGCQEKQQPSFLGRSYQDCQNGDEQACKMLSALQQAQKVQQRKPIPPKPTPVQMDVKVMLEGVRRANSAPPKESPDTAPSNVPETDQPRTPDGP